MRPSCKQLSTRSNKDDMRITVNDAKCPQDHKCPAIGVCPVDAISQEGFKLPNVDPTTCIECMACVSYCPMGAFLHSE